MVDEILYTDSFGRVTEEQYRLYRERNVTPAEHDELLEKYGRGDFARGLIMAAVRDFSRDGQYEHWDMLRAEQWKGLGQL